jgi:hypothetical protein
LKEERHIMEWYFTELCRPNPMEASIFGAIQLIVMAAVYIFGIGFPKPVRKD